MKLLDLEDVSVEIWLTQRLSDGLCLPVSTCLLSPKKNNWENPNFLYQRASVGAHLVQALLGHPKVLRD